MNLIKMSSYIYIIWNKYACQRRKTGNKYLKTYLKIKFRKETFSCDISTSAVTSTQSYVNDYIGMNKKN